MRPIRSFVFLALLGSLWPLYLEAQSAEAARDVETSVEKLLDETAALNRQLEELARKLNRLEPEEALRSGEELLTAGRLLGALDIAGARTLIREVAAKLGIDLRETAGQYLDRLFVEAAAAVDSGDAATARAGVEAIKVTRRIYPGYFVYSRHLEVIVLEAKVLALEGKRQEALQVLERRNAVETESSWYTSRSSWSTLAILVEIEMAADAGRDDEVVSMARGLALERRAEMTVPEVAALYRVVGGSLLRQVLGDPRHSYYRFAQRLDKLDEPERKDGLACLANRMLWEEVGLPRLARCE